MEHEEDIKEWAKEHLSDVMADQFFTLSKEHREQMDVEMLDILAKVKELMRNGVPPEAPEAMEVVIKVT
ncbi:TipAS antibiotic-recognition domain-containing protein, partial [Pseudomonas sp. 2995-1]|uniref:TipAS antibiotic-recognition domain-containing protein n=1 Tax=Pseudomonas sp. 2995-1 TaxID=1712679 RepID=UPI000C666BB0